MSFADLARHLLVCDELLAKGLREGPQKPDHGNAGAIFKREGFEQLIAAIEHSGAERRALIEEIDDFDRPVFDERFGDTTVWWVVMRGNLDHEVHHRGQIAAYLRWITSRT